MRGGGGLEDALEKMMHLVRWKIVCMNKEIRVV